MKIKTDSKNVAQAIQKDIDMGVYESWPILKDKLQYISEKLININFIENMELTENELKILTDNEYIDKDEYDEED